MTGIRINKVSGSVKINGKTQRYTHHSDNPNDTKKIDEKMQLPKAIKITKK